MYDNSFLNGPNPAFSEWPEECDEPHGDNAALQAALKDALAERNKALAEAAEARAALARAASFAMPTVSSTSTALDEARICAVIEVLRTAEKEARAERDRWCQALLEAERLLTFMPISAMDAEPQRSLENIYLRVDALRRARDELGAKCDKLHSYLYRLLGLVRGQKPTASIDDDFADASSRIIALLERQ